MMEEDLQEMSSSHFVFYLSTLTYYTQQTFFQRERNLSDRLIDKVRTKLCTMFSLLTPSTILYIQNDAVEPYDKFCITLLWRD